MVCANNCHNLSGCGISSVVVISSLSKAVVNCVFICVFALVVSFPERYRSIR